MSAPTTSFLKMYIFYVDDVFLNKNNNMRVSQNLSFKNTNSMSQMDFIRTKRKKHHKHIYNQISDNGTKEVN